MASAAPARIGIGNGQLCSLVSFDTKNAEMPAKAICASEICPTKPVSTTIDRQMITPISVFVSASRNV